MKSLFLVSLFAFACISTFSGCGEVEQRKVIVEEVKGYQPQLPAVPKIPKPNIAETFSDGSYSVYGLRRQLRKTIEQVVSVTAYIAKIYEKPECPEGQTCHVIMPHLWLADSASETIEKRYLRLVGYAQSFKDMEEEKERIEKGEEPKELPEGVVLPPVIWDWRLGHKYKITGRFTRQSGSGFMATNGVFEYEDHECLDCPTEEEEEEGKADKK